MGQEVSVARLRARWVLRNSRLFGLVQSILIVLLLVWMANEYNHNQFFQAWAAARLGGFSFFLNGTLAAVYAGLVITYFLSVQDANKETVIVERKDVLAEARVAT